MKYSIRNISVVLIFFTLIEGASAAGIDTVRTYSPSMKKNIKAVVITPDSYKEAKALPVV
jgi:hypothetical protein